MGAKCTKCGSYNTSKVADDPENPVYNASISGNQTATTNNNRNLNGPLDPETYMTGDLYNELVNATGYQISNHSVTVKPNRLDNNSTRKVAEIDNRVILITHGSSEYDEAIKK